MARLCVSFGFLLYIVKVGLCHGSMTDAFTEVAKLLSFALSILQVSSVCRLMCKTTPKHADIQNNAQQSVKKDTFELFYLFQHIQLQIQLAEHHISSPE